MSKVLWIILAIIAALLFLFGAIVLSIKYFGRKEMRKGWEITGWIALAVGLVLLVPSLYLSLATPKVVTVEKTVERTEMIVPKRGVSMY